MISASGETVVNPFPLHRHLTDASNNAQMLKYLMTAVVASVIALGIAAAWLLTRPAAPKPFAEAYHEALAEFPGSEASIDAGIRRFESTYADLTDDRTGARVRELYAEALYFNDSLKTFRERSALADYMQATSDMLAHSDVTIDRILRDGADVFVRWTMEFRTGTTGTAVHSRSIGMTHLRFDEAGRIVVHQDFWDSASGLYRNLPVVGYLLKLVDARMASGSG
jgi:hypothetical protein